MDVHHDRPDAGLSRTAHPTISNPPAHQMPQNLRPPTACLCTTRATSHFALVLGIERVRQEQAFISHASSSQVLQAAHEQQVANGQQDATPARCCVHTHVQAAAALDTSCAPL